MDDALRDLASVTRASVDVRLKVRGVEIVVSEVTMAHLAAFIVACSPFLESFDRIADVKQQTADLVDAGGSARRLPDRFGFFKMIGEHSGAFLDAAALVCEIQAPGEGGVRAFLARLRPDEFFHIALAVVEVNGDFFILRLAPALTAFFQSVGRIGSGRSSASSPLDTADPSESTLTATASS